MLAGSAGGTRIAIDARLAGGSSTGDSTYWTGLIQELARTGSDFTFLLFSNAPKPPEIPGSPNFVWHEVQGAGRLWSLFSLPVALRRSKASLFHTQYNFSPLIQTRTVTTVHDVSFFIGPQWFRPKDRVLLQKGVPRSIRRAQLVLTVSNTSRAEIETHVRAANGKVRVVYPDGHPSIVRMPRDLARRMVESRLEFKAPFLLTVGTRWPRKNTALAVDAAEALPTHIPHRLVVTGKAGWGEEALGSRRIAPGYVDFELLSALYSAADLYIAPSRHEGFGMTVVEAMRCGCPVVSSSGGALPETLGGAGRVVESWDAGDWSEAIASTLGDLSNLESMRERGLRRAQQFSWKETARKTLEAYREALG